MSEIDRSHLSLTDVAPEIQLPRYDYTTLQEESREVISGIPFQFGKAHDMKIGLEDGEWHDDGGQSRWKLKISSQKAYSINLIFDRLILPKGAMLYIYDQNRTTVMGPIDESNSDVEGEFWTDLLPGDGVVLELLGDKEALQQVKLSISKVIHGYVNTFSSTGFGASASCNIDIDCPVGLPFQLESHAVARLLIRNGESFCTGAMMNNTCNDFTPYLLTADHCLDAGVNN